MSRLERLLPTTLKDRLQFRHMRRNPSALEPLENMRYEVMFGENQIHKRLGSLADQLISDYQDEQPILIPIANGAAIGASDLIRIFMEKGVDLPMEFIKVSTYKGGTRSEGKSKVKFKINPELIIGRDVIVMDDILDTGNTLSAVTEKLIKMGARSVRSLALLRKPEEVRETEFEADYVGFDIPAIWVEGYGLDSRYFGRGRRDIVAVYDNSNFSVAA